MIKSMYCENCGQIECQNPYCVEILAQKEQGRGVTDCYRHDYISNGKGWRCQFHDWWGEGFNCPGPKRKLVYIGGSMRERARIRACYETLTAAGYNCFIDWIMPGEATDEKWQEFEQGIGRGYHEALQGAHATDVFEFDKTWLDKSDAFVLALPAGKSAHIELGYMVGKGKPAFILMEEEPERWDLMYRFATKVVRSHKELVMELGKTFSLKSTD